MKRLLLLSLLTVFLAFGQIQTPPQCQVPITITIFLPVYSGAYGMLLVPYNIVVYTYRAANPDGTCQQPT
jgi:hypothetical protein